MKKTYLNIFVAIIAVVIGLGLVINLAFLTKGNIITTGKGEQQQEQTKQPEQSDNPNAGGPTGVVGAIVSDGEGNGISVLPAKLPISVYSLYDIEPYAESAYLLTATVSLSYADNTAVDWSVSWVNSSSKWASGKTVTDYVTVKPTSDGALTATVTCLQAFGEQINVVVTSRDKSTVSANCLVDYVKKVVDISMFSIGSSSMALGNFENTLYSGGKDTTLCVKEDLSIGTMDSDFSYSVTMCINSQVISALTAQGFTVNKNAGEYFEIYTVGAFLSNAIDNYALVAQGQRRSQFITAMKSLGTGAEVGQIKLCLSNSYDSFEFFFSIILDSSCTGVSADNIELDESHLFF